MSGDNLRPVWLVLLDRLYGDQALLALLCPETIDRLQQRGFRSDRRHRSWIWTPGPDEGTIEEFPPGSLDRPPGWRACSYLG